MTTRRQPLVLIPQHFGCLVFDRRTSRYLPFDREATGLLCALHRQPLNAVLAPLPADVLDVDVPADHLVGPLAVHLEIVGACNLTCTHCFAGVLPRNHHPLTLPELDTLFGDLARLGSFRLGLTGGEPL